MRIGLNLAGLSQSLLIFYADLMKQAGAISGDAGHGEFALSPTGWPILGDAGVSGRQVKCYVRSCVEWPGNDRGAPCTPSGTYWLKYTPNAVCGPSDVILASATPSFTMTPIGPLITNNDGTVQQQYSGAWVENPVYTGAAFMCVWNGSGPGAVPDDVRIYAPGVDPANPPEFWGPGLAQLAIAASLRTVVTYDLPAWREYADLPTEDVRSYAVVEGRSGISGMPFTSLLRLLLAMDNQQGTVGLHLCFPPHGSDALAQALAADCKAILWPSNPIRWELSDEPWNWDFDYFQGLGALGPAYANGTLGDAMSGYCAESARLADIFESALGRPIIRTLNCQADNSGTTVEYLMFSSEQKLRIDEFTIGGYEDTRLIDSPPPFPQTGPWTAGELLQAVRASIGTGVAKLAIHRKAIDSFPAFAGTPISCYESGICVPHLTQLSAPGALDATRIAQNRENLAAFVHPLYAAAEAAWFAKLADPALGITVAHLYCDAYIQAEESGRWPVYFTYAFPGQLPGLNDGANGWLDVRPSLVAGDVDTKAGQAIGQPPLDTTASPRAWAIQQWNLDGPPVVVAPSLPVPDPIPAPTPLPDPIPAPAPADPVAEAQATLVTAFNAYLTALRSIVISQH
jgi:hypothetical protein